MMPPAESLRWGTARRFRILVETSGSLPAGRQVPNPTVVRRAFVAMNSGRRGSFPASVFLPRVGVGTCLPQAGAAARKFMSSGNAAYHAAGCAGSDGHIARQARQNFMPTSSQIRTVRSG